MLISVVIGLGSFAAVLMVFRNSKKAPAKLALLAAACFVCLLAFFKAWLAIAVFLGTAVIAGLAFVILFASVWRKD